MTTTAAFCRMGSACSLLLLCCVACGSDPWRPPSARGGLSCATTAFKPTGSSAGTDTLLRFWNRGTEAFGRVATAPRLLEALYDSAGRPLVLASIAEERARDSIVVVALAVDFRSGSPTATRFEVPWDRVDQRAHREERAYRRFSGPPFMPAVVSAGSATSAKPLSAKETKKARSLAAQLWELRCPRA